MIDRSVEPAPAAASSNADVLAQTADVREAEQRETPLVEADLLVEDISIDGMCGVY